MGLSIEITPNPNNPLEIAFRGVSGVGEVVTAWAWNFGDSTNSNLQNPTHAYVASGIYLVVLNALTDAGVINLQRWFTFQITPEFNVPIMTLLQSQIPEELLRLFQPNLIISMQKWQMYLQPQVYPILLAENTFYESAWPILWNHLISNLIRYDLLMDESIALALRTLQSSSTTVTGATIEATGSIKRVETGPAQVEFYEDKKSDPGAVGDFARAVYETGRGMIEQYKNQCCIMAHRLDATLPFCPPKKVNFLFRKTSC